jgi:hypothetical protein
MVHRVRPPFIRAMFHLIMALQMMQMEIENKEKPSAQKI